MRIFYVWMLLSISGCASQSEKTLYMSLGGQETINKIVENFIEEIGNDEKIFPFFEDTKIERFSDKLSEQLCQITGGPCQYTGDSMSDSHANMGITEESFNHTVELLINAMSRAKVSHRLQNKILKRLAPMREDILS